MAYKVFISYKRKYAAGWAEMLRLALHVYKEIPLDDIFMDVHNLSSEWSDDIKEAIRESVNFIIIFPRNFQELINDNT